MSRSVECKHQVVVGGSESRMGVSGVMAELQAPILKVKLTLCG